MHLNSKDAERLMIYTAGEIARKRKERGLKLNYVESVAYIAANLYEMARNRKSVAELMQLGMIEIGRASCRERV